MTGRHQQGGRDAQARKLSAGSIGDPQLHPFRQRSLLVSAGERVIETLRQAHFAAPAHTPFPARGLQEVGRGRHGIADAAPEIAAPIPVGVDRVTLINARHELHVPHRAGPRAFHALGGYVAGIDDAQRRHELGGEVGAAPGITGQRRQRIRNRRAAEVRAEIGLETPEGHQVLAWHAELALDVAQHRGVPGEKPAAPCNALGRDAPVVVLGEGQNEFRLLAIELEHRFLLRHLPEHFVYHALRDTLSEGRSLQPAYTGREIAVIRQGASCSQKKDERGESRAGQTRFTTGSRHHDPYFAMPAGNICPTPAVAGARFRGTAWNRPATCLLAGHATQSRPRRLSPGSRRLRRNT